MHHPTQYIGISPSTVGVLRSAAPTSGLPGLTFERHFTHPGVDPFETVEWERRDATITGADGKVFFRQDQVEVPKAWSQTAINVVAQKYFRGTLGTPQREDSVRTMIGRVADTIAQWGARGSYFATAEDCSAFRDELVHLLLHQKMAFNSPVWFNCGVEENPQMSACFIQAVDDTMSSILDLVKAEGMLFKYGSGTGSNLSSLRSSREHLNGGGTASGPVSFMRGFDAFAGAIKSGGKTRRAAKMVILNIDHPDVVDFIDCKAIEEKKAWALIDAGYDGGFNVPGGAYDSVGYQNANHSVRVSDAFMQAVEADGPWQTRNVKDDAVAETHCARDLMRQMAQAAWICGDPGIQYDTTINDWHTCAGTARINGSNPCVTGDTQVLTSRGWWRIDQLLDGDWEVMGSDGQFHPIRPAFLTGVKQVYKLRTKLGIELKLTADHRVLTTNRGDVPACELTTDDAINIGFEKAVRVSPSGEIIEELTPTDDRLESLEPLGHEMVYDLTEPVTNHFVANGIVVHNCSEYMFLDDSACNLASLNLRKFQAADGTFIIQTFQCAVQTAILAMEIIVGSSSYPTKQIAANSHRFRPLGLGYANLGALLMSLGLPYDSDEGRAYAAAITSLMCAEAYRMSARIAADATGPFDGYAENRETFLQVIRKHTKATHDISMLAPGTIVGAAIEAWECAVGSGEITGFRNAQTTVLAPTGTIAFLMDCDTTGVEPDIAVVKYKRLVGGGLLKIVNHTVPEALDRLRYSPTAISAIIAHIDVHETIAGAPHLKKEHLPVFDCAIGSRSIHYMGHIRMMSAVQPFLSGAISKTVNLPTECTVEDIEDAYIQAWKLGLKSIAVYRDGCKRTQPLSTSREQATSSTVLTSAPDLSGPPAARRHRLPDEREAITRKFTIGGHEGYITVGLYANGAPGEIFVRMAKEGSVIAGLMDSFATAISMALQHGVPLHVLIEKFKGTRFEPSGFTGNQEIPIATSIMDYLFRWLGLRFTQTTAEVVETSPVRIAETDAPPCHECGTLMVRNGTCHKCPNCGSTSGCS